MLSPLSAFIERVLCIYTLLKKCTKLFEYIDWKTNIDFTTNRKTLLLDNVPLCLILNLDLKKKHFKTVYVIRWLPLVV